ncbi:MAG: hypothetical protein LW823_08400 [Rickettsiales bacterium]|jgi:hypothetical protein|nr:hypothetical protein [Rickettsiales bacterium]
MTAKSTGQKSMPIVTEDDEEFIASVFLGNRTYPTFVVKEQDSNGKWVRPDVGGLLLDTHFYKQEPLIERLASHGIVAEIAEPNEFGMSRLLLPFKNNPDIANQCRRAYLKEEIAAAIVASGLKESPNDLAQALSDGLKSAGITPRAKRELLRRTENAGHIKLE